MSFADRNVLVTGGAGFIGSHVVDELVVRDARVTVVDDLRTGFREFVDASDRVTLVEADLLDQEALDQAMQGQDFVFHLAANADVKDGLKHPRVDVEQNVLATQNVLEAMRAAAVRRIAFSSSGAIYGEPETFPTPEDAPLPVQTSLYGASKIAAEGLLSSYALGYGFQTFAFRFVSQLGPRYTHGHVYDFFMKLRRDPSRLEVLGDGHQKKSYLHVRDCVDGMFTVIENPEADPAVNVYNIGHDDFLELNDSIAIICRELGVKPELAYTGGVRGWIGDAPKVLLDCSKLKGLGWRSKRTLEDSVVETLRFLVDHPYTHRRE